MKKGKSIMKTKKLMSGIAIVIITLSINTLFPASIFAATYPTVRTDSATGVSTTGATLNGYISNTGSANITNHGFIYWEDGKISTQKQVSLGTKSGTGSFSKAVSGLKSGVKYAYQAYANNSVGAGNGVIVYFTTGANTTTYTISYNANGGSGAPSAQTKTQNVTLTLSSTKPTRANYTFLGWATSSTATTAQYQPGGSYTANAATTLYAVWKSAQATTYTISYNANGGSGAPSAQTKIQNVILILSSTKPTRTNYTFLGWATSATATTAQYQPNGNYTANAAAMLYAVWKPVSTTTTLSGKDWCSKFLEPSTEEGKLSQLSPDFQRRARGFINELRSKNYTVTVTSAVRPAERAYLMHYAWEIAKNNLDPKDVPSKPGVNINWVHPTLAESKKAAQSMVDTYGMVSHAALETDHTKGNAMDITINGSKTPPKEAISIGKDTWKIMWGGDWSGSDYDPVHWYIRY